MKELIRYIAKTLVDRPDQVTVSQADRSPIMIYELRVANQDIGKIIGKQGRNVSALRTILNAAAGRAKKKTILKIVE
ncbi:MAG: KH domain-containing protein [Thermodesulfobacteriota bacterium]